MSKFVDKIIKEGVRKTADGFQFDFNSDVPGDIMSLKFRFRKNLIKKIGNTLYCSYYAYSLEKSENSGQLMKAVKLFDSSIDSNNLMMFLNKAVMGFNKNFNGVSFDTIVTPESSSVALSELANQLKSKLGSTNIFPGAFVKSATMDIKFDEQKVAGLPEKSRKQFMGIYNKMLQSGKPFKIKEIYPPYRKFFKDFIIFNKDSDRKLYNAVEGKNVVLIDDYKTTGTTLKVMLDHLVEAGANMVIIFVLLKIE